MTHCRWNILPGPEKSLADTSEFPPLISRILFHRGLASPSQIEAFIASDSRLSGDPSLLPGMHEAVARIYRALLCGESIGVYGDFDADGVTATALLVEGLGKIGVTAVPYIPHRVTEGYGLKTDALENLRKQGISLVISVDCGITAVEPVIEAKRRGLDIIVTDHHVPLAQIPQAAAVIDPKLPGSCYPFPDLSGVGVAFKLLQAVFNGLGRQDELEMLFDLVALGTVADMVNLLGENRYLVKKGLRVLNESPRLGIREMAAQANLGERTLESESISFVLAPRLNAAGRLDHANASYRLLTTDSVDEARKLAAWLQQKNSERQELTADAVRVAREQVIVPGIGGTLFASHPEFPAGICGLVASRLVDEYYRPAVVVRRGEQYSSGSCRSIPEFNMIEALNGYEARGEGFLQFGGHAQAAGFTILTKNLTSLAAHLSQEADLRLAGVDLRPRIDVDAEVKLTDLGGDIYPWIQKLAPFGQGNPRPTFLSRGVEVMECRGMGNGGDHLRLKVRQGGTVWSAVSFGMGCHQAEVCSPLDIVFSVEADRWNGTERLRLNVLDFRATA